MTVPRVSDYIQLQHSPMRLEARAVRNGNECMQVAISLSASYACTEVYVTTDEARRLAASLTTCADHYDQTMRTAA